MTTAAATPAGLSPGRPARTRARPTLLDVALGLLVGVSLLWAMTLAADLESPAQLPPVAFVAHAAVIIGSAMWRAAPRAGLLVAMAGVMSYHALDGIPIGLAWPLILPSYGVARRGNLSLGMAVSAFYMAGMFFHRLLVVGAVSSLAEVQVAIHTIAQEAVLLAAALLVGEVVRSRAQLAADAQERLRLVQRRHEQETERRIADERLRIAHDLHDVAAHTVSVISLHANVAAERFDDAPDRARDAVQTIRETSERAARELRAVVGILREPDGEPPVGGTDAIRASVARARDLALDVTLHLDVADAALHGAPGVAASRIVQEALTNVARHADASHVVVRIAAAGDSLHLEVEDDGRGTPGDGRDVSADVDRRDPDTAGVGLLGIRERAEALGGTAVWGPSPAGGFRVACRLPRGDQP